MEESCFDTTTRPFKVRHLRKILLLHQPKANSETSGEAVSISHSEKGVNFHTAFRLCVLILLIALAFTASIVWKITQDCLEYKHKFRIYVNWDRITNNKNQQKRVGISIYVFWVENRARQFIFDYVSLFELGYLRSQIPFESRTCFTYFVRISRIKDKCPFGGGGVSRSLIIRKSYVKEGRGIWKNLIKLQYVCAHHNFVCNMF